MTFDDLFAKISQTLPGAYYGQDNEGQLIIYTGLQETDDVLNELIPFIPEDEKDTKDIPSERVTVTVDLE